VTSYVHTKKNTYARKSVLWILTDFLQVYFLIRSFFFLFHVSGVSASVHLRYQYLHVSVQIHVFSLIFRFYADSAALKYRYR
jgi:hypothetical protein